MPRIVYETHKIEDVQLPFIFHNAHFRKREDSSNWHENIELLCFTGGEATLYIDGNPMKVRRGDIAVINVEKLHSISSDTAVSYYCLIIDNSFWVDNGIQIADLKFSELIIDEQFFEKFCEVASKLEKIKKGEFDMFSVASVRYDVLGLLIHLCYNYLSTNKAEDEKSNAYNAVKNIIHYIRQSTGRVSLDEIAGYAQMSKYHMSREFKRITGTTIFEYLNIFRCERAKRMLYSGATVSEAAMEVGFDNMSYFSRTFKKYMDMLPSECKKRPK